MMCKMKMNLYDNLNLKMSNSLIQTHDSEALNQ